MKRIFYISQGSDGFGFTIFESIQGQRVKKILYPERCENLLEGDTLLEMRTTYPHGSPSCPVGEEHVTNFRGMPHHELVSILRECPIGFWAKLVVRRNSPKHRLAHHFHFSYSALLNNYVKYIQHMSGTVIPHVINNECER